MAARALIIAIENYPDAQGGSLAKTLPGTLQAALDFRDWLLAKWATEGRAAADTEVLFCSEPKQSFGTGATQQDILGALTTLRDHGQNQTEELFLFFSGHGFLFVDRPGVRADILIASDYRNPDVSGHCCLPLDLMVTWLQAHLGPGKHYCFVDACRNVLTGTQIQISRLLPFDPQGTAEAATFVMQSAVAGAVTSVGGPFPAALLGGLKGAGRAKVWGTPRTAMYVRYDTLRRHLKATLPTNSFSSRNIGPDGDGESEAILAKIQPVTDCKCRVKIDGSMPAGLVGRLTITPQNPPTPIARQVALRGEELALQPDDYWMVLEVDQADVEPEHPQLVDLYSDQVVTWTVTPEVPLAMRHGRVVARNRPPSEPLFDRPLPEPPPPGGDLDLSFPPDSTVILRNLESGVEVKAQQSRLYKVPRGQYLATLHGPRGDVIKRVELDLSSGYASLDLGRWDDSVPRRSIAGRLPNNPYMVDFSESLGGAISDSDLDLWLALLGGGRILGPQGDYSKIARFPLHDFSGETAGAAPIYVLAGFEHPDIPLLVGLSSGPEVRWMRATRPPDMLGILEAYFPDRANAHLLSFKVGDEESYSIATTSLPNRALLVTLTLEEDRSPRISQYLLPLGHLVHRLPPEVEERLRHRNHLGDVRFLAQATRAFRRRRTVATAMNEGDLVSLLYAKWLDPIGNSLAAYELIRRGHRDQIDIVIDNMKLFFRELPDTWCLARLAGDRSALPHGIPLFQDGLRAFGSIPEELPLPVNRLDFTSPWTAWRGAVKE
jgi:hypothetical protein